MVNTIATQTLNDGPRNLVVKVNITGDGSGEEAATQLLDISSFSGAPTKVRVDKIDAFLEGFSVSLAWDATADLDFHSIPQGDSFLDATPYGGLQNDAGAGVTGDINFTTVGLGANDKGSFVIWMRKS